jgi:hypothetical protein
MTYYSSMIRLRPEGMIDLPQELESGLAADLHEL